MKLIKNNLTKWEIAVAQPITTKKMSGTYHCPELRLPAVRIGADDHQVLGSRRGKYVYFKDGRKELA